MLPTNDVFTSDGAPLNRERGKPAHHASDVGAEVGPLQRSVEHQLRVVEGVDFDERLFGDGDVVDLLGPRRDVESCRHPKYAVAVGRK